MNINLRRFTIGVLFFASFGVLSEPAHAGTFSLSSLTRYESFSDFFNGIRTPLDPPDKVYIYDYAVEHRAYLFSGVDGETVTSRFIRPDGVFIDTDTVYDARKACWKDGNNCVLSGDGTVTTHLFLEGFPREVLGGWTYQLLNNGVVVYTENFSLVSPELTIAGGDGQTALAGEVLPQPLEVRFLSDDGTTPLPFRFIRFEITGSPRIGNNDTAAFLTANGTGTGTQTVLTVTTNNAGYAHVFLHLGSVDGTYEVTATTDKAPLDAPIFTGTAGVPLDEDPDDDKENGDPAECAAVGDPINLITGNNYQLATDIAAVAPALLKFERHYNSRDPLVADMGWNWRHTYDRSIATETTGKGGSATTTAYVRRPDGKRFSYTEDSDGNWISDPDVHHTLTQDESGWTFMEDNTSERFDLDGKIVSITELNGRAIQLTYSASTNLLQSVIDDMGSTLQFVHNVDGRLESVTDQASRSWGYSYDTQGNLTGVENPDLTNKQYHYENIDFPHALTGITDERGIRFVTFDYNVDGLATSSYHAGNVGRVDIDYSPGGSRLVVSSRNNTSAYQTKVRHGSGFVAQLSGPSCSSCAASDSDYDYDTSNNLVKITSKGVVTTFGGYGSSDNPGYMINAPGTVNERRTDFSYDPRFDGLVTQVVEPSVSDISSWYHITRNTYDNSGNIIRVVESGFTPGSSPISVALTPREATFAYSGSLGQLSLIDGPRTDVSDVRILEYYPNFASQGNNRARLQRLTNEMGHAERDDIQYTATGQVLSELRLNGLAVSYTYYPGNDRLETATESAGGVPRTTRWTYLATGEVESITVGDGSVDAAPLFFEYDDARRLIGVRDGLGNERKFILNSEGDVESDELYDPALMLRKVTTSVFDTYNRLQLRTRANESVTRTYNADGSLATETDGRNISTSFAYDDVRRLTSTTVTIDGAPKVVAVDFNKDTDEISAISPPSTGTTFYATDDFRNLLSITGPRFSEVTTATHDPAGNELTTQDSNGQIFVHQYDALGRVLSDDGPGTADDITYAYDSCLNGVGRLCSVTTASATVSYSYNSFGDITSSQNTSRTYDGAGRRKSTTYPSGAIVDYSYDASGQVQSIQINGVPLISTITHAPFGPTTGLLFGNGLSYTATYDNAYRATQQHTPGVLDRSYDSYDGNGNLLQMTETVGGVPAANVFSYTDDNRLSTASGVFGTRGYTYTQNGHRASVDDGTEVLPYGNSGERLTIIGRPPEVIGGGGETPEELLPGTSINEDIGYDSVGNTTTRVENDWTCIATTDPQGEVTYNCTEAVVRSWVYTYTSLNQIQSVILDGVVLANYEYNGLSQRVRKILSDGTVTQYIYDLDGSLVAELDGVGTVLREYIYLNGAPIAMSDLSNGAQNIYYIHNDHLGTPKAMTNNVGTVVWRASHDPYGAADVNEDPDGDTTSITLNIRFPGQYYDQESALHYNYYRYYNPATGRYMASDPIGLEGGLNSYGFVEQNPLKSVDPFGLEPNFYDFLTCTFGNCGEALVESTVNDTVEALGDRVVEIGDSVGGTIYDCAACAAETIVGLTPEQIAQNVAEDAATAAGVKVVDAAGNVVSETVQDVLHRAQGKAAKKLVIKRAASVAPVVAQVVWTADGIKIIYCTVKRQNARN